MASTRVQLSNSELSIIESYLEKLASSPEELKLLYKIKKALVSVGGRVSVDSFSSGSQTSVSDRDFIDMIGLKIINNESISESEKVKYFNITGMEL